MHVYLHIISWSTHISLENYSSFPILQEEWTPLHKAARSGDTDAVQQLLGDHVDVNSRTVVCVPALHWLMESVFRSIVFATQDGKTALHIASLAGHAGVVRVLIGACAQLNLQDEVEHLWSGNNSI